MGRHSSDFSGGFWRSLGLSAAKWAIFGAIPLLASAGLFLLLASGGGEPKVSPRPTSQVAGVRATAAPTKAPSAVPTETPPAPPELDKSGDLQVLNGTGKDGLAARVAGRLRREGYTVVAARNPLRRYEKTTILFRSDSEEQGRQIASLLGATEIRPAPEQLEDNVRVTVVLGMDYKAP